MLRTECSGLNPVHKHGCIANGVYFTFSPSISSSHLIEFMRHLIRDLLFIFPVHVKVLGIQIVPRHWGGTSVHQSFFHRGFCVVTSSVFLSARDFVKAVLFWDLRPSSFGTSKQCVNLTISSPQLFSTSCSRGKLHLLAFLPRVFSIPPLILLLLGLRIWEQKARCPWCASPHSSAEAKNTGPNTSPRGGKRKGQKKGDIVIGFTSKQSNDMRQEEWVRSVPCGNEQPAIKAIRAEESGKHLGRPLGLPMSHRGAIAQSSKLSSLR